MTSDYRPRRYNHNGNFTRDSSKKDNYQKSLLNTE